MRTVAFTSSDDGTTNRHINYDAHHIHLMAEDYGSEDPSQKVQHTQFAGLTSSPDQSSEQEILDWKDIFADVTDVFNRSPMGKKASIYSCSLDILSKWFGSNTDHCSKEKKAAWLMSDAK
jgi:hypothetical protein